MPISLVDQYRIDLKKISGKTIEIHEIKNLKCEIKEIVNKIINKKKFEKIDDTTKSTEEKVESRIEKIKDNKDRRRPKTDEDTTLQREIHREISKAK